MAKYTKTSMSQLGADDWVLSMFPTTYTGYFVDAGSGDGVELSNTYKLEQHGWNGICIDAIPRNYNDRPRSKVVEAVLYSVADKEVDFLVAHENDYSGISDCLGVHKNHVVNTLQCTKKYKTSLLHEVLDTHDAPEYIAYLNLDVEGAEYEVLRVFPFDKYKFGCITFEHNNEIEKKELVHNLLLKNGYQHVTDVRWDAWYVSKDNIEYMTSM